MFLEQARLVLTQRRYNLSQTSRNTQEHETRRGLHGKKQDDKAQQKGQGVTESEGNAKELGSGHWPTEPVALDQVAASPAAPRTGGRDPTRGVMCTAEWSSGLYASDGRVPGYGQES